MASRILSHPFRIGPSGAAVTVVEGSEAANAEAIAVLLGTRLGERPLVPGFGSPDPTFDRINAADLQAGLEAYGPPGVRVTSVEVEWDDTGTIADTLITFTDGST